MYVIIGQRSKIQIEAIGVTRIDKPCGGANIKTKKIKTMIISKLASTMQKNACAEVVSVGNAQLLYYFIFRQENSVLSFSFQARVNFQVTSFPLVSYYSAILCLVPFPLENHPSLSIFCELFGESEIVLLPWDRFRDEKTKKKRWNGACCRSIFIYGWAIRFGYLVRYACNHRSEKYMDISPLFALPTSSFVGSFSTFFYFSLSPPFKDPTYHPRRAYNNVRIFIYIYISIYI